MPSLRHLSAGALACLGLISTGSVSAESAYISDELTVPLRSGPSGQHRIVYAALPSGTQLEILSVNEDAGFSQIRTARGTEGWVRSQYLVSSPIAKQRLAAAQREIANLKQRLANTNEKVSALNETSRAQQSSNQASSAQIEKLQNELDALKAISDGAVATHEENLKLKEMTARLQDELDDLSEERDLLESNASNEGIMLGAGFILLGLLAGVLIKARPQRSAWS